MACDTLIAKDFIDECGRIPKAGIENAYLINLDDIDKSASTLAVSNTQITALVLDAGAKIYQFTSRRDAGQASHQLAQLEFATGYLHTVQGRILLRGAEERETIQDLVDGGRVAVIVEKVDTGLAGELKYEIYGYESGLKILNDDYNSNETSGVSTIILQTMEGEEESTAPKLWDEGTYVGGEEAFITDNLYARP